MLNAFLLSKKSVKFSITSKGIPIYLETPLDDEGHKEEIAMIKEGL